MSGRAAVEETIGRHLRALTLELKALGVTKEQLLNAFDDEESLAANQFSTLLTPLETICLVLHSNGLPVKDIARHVARPANSVTASLRSAQRKHVVVPAPDSPFRIPVSVVRDRTVAASEAIVLHLSRHYRLPNITIADQLGRDQRNTWALLRSAKRKLKEART